MKIKSIALLFFLCLGFLHAQQVELPGSYNSKVLFPSEAEAHHKGFHLVYKTPENSQVTAGWQHFFPSACLNLKRQSLLEMNLQLGTVVISDS